MRRRWIKDLRACEQALQFSNIELQLERMQTDLVRTELSMFQEQCEGLLFRQQQTIDSLERLFVSTNSALRHLRVQVQEQSVMLEQLREREQQQLSLIAHLTETVERATRVRENETNANDESATSAAVASLIACADSPAANPPAANPSCADSPADPSTGANKATHLPDFFECKICHERPMTHACLPCGHFLMCSQCSGKVQQCPVCRKHVERAQVIHCS